ncbi:MAG: carboxypeptidase regulatory-like domain-containing protein [Polyangiaceae bacterium]|nr:carboxypeptidase regulatory-like domain-containing protein [Polyangiaceae bacterium]
MERRSVSRNRPFVERWIVWLAWLTCLSAVWGLSDGRLHLPTPGEGMEGPAPTQVGAAIALLVRSAEGGVGRTATARVYAPTKDERYLEVSRRVVCLDERVELSGLPPGEVWLILEAHGHARASRRLTLELGTTSVDLDLELGLGLAVSVRDPDGNPLGGVTVLVTANDPLPHGALTQVDGTVRFHHLDAAPWLVTVAAPGFETVTRHGVRGGLSVTLRPLGVLEVSVERPDGAPAAAATVVLVGSRLWPPRRVPTDVGGHARVAGLLTGSYDLRATLGSEVSDTVFGLALGPSAHEAVTLRLRPGRFVTVLVSDGEGEAATGVPNADVVVVEDGLGPFPQRGRTGTDGKVRLGPLPIAPASVSARADGFVARSGVPVPDLLDEVVRIALLRAARLEGEVVDARGRPIDGATIEVIGTDPYGMPVADSPGAQSFQRLHFGWSLAGPLPLVPAGELGVMPGPVPPIPRAGSEPLTFATLDLDLAKDVGARSWVSGVDGRFSAVPVTPGRIRAFVRHPAYVEGISDPVVLAPGGTTEVRVTLEVGGNLEGRLVDDRGFPVAGARVEVVAVRGTTEVVTFTADDGTFAFAAIPAEVTLSLSRPEDPARTVLARTLTVPADSTTKIEWILPAPREPVRVLVVDDTGRPVDSAQVSALGADPAAPFRETRFTDADGRAEFEDARGRALTFVVEAMRLTRGTMSIEAVPAEVRVTLTAGVLVSGEVTAVRGRFPVEGARTTIVTDGQRFAAVTDREGRYELHDIPPGPALLVVSHPGHATREIDVTVQRTTREDRPFVLPTVDLTEPGVIEGVVRDPSGKPVVGARVAVGIVPSFLPAGKLPPGIALTDAAGHFVLDALSPGEVGLEAYAANVGRGASTATVAAGRTVTGVVITLDEEAGEDEPPASGNLAVTLGERGDPSDVVVVQVSAESEAERAGLRAGDLILEVDGVEVEDMNDARARLSGRIGTDVIITVERDGRATRLRIAREPVRR